MKAMTFDEIVNGGEQYKTSKLIKSLTSQAGVLNHFYLTGYEGLCLMMSHAELTHAIISSVVPMGGELLVVGSKEVCSEWRHACHELSIRVTVVDTAESDLVKAVETILSVNRTITNVMTTSDLDCHTLCELGRVAHENRCSFVVDNSTDELSVEDTQKAGVDFTIAATAEISVIIARRSKLVMTEGNARRSEHDIYALWQSTLTLRNSTWVPMA